MVVVCPITNQVKGYAFEVPIPVSSVVTGVILVDQIKAVDWVSRTVTKLGTSLPSTLAEVDAKLRALLNLP
jgi:mRNA interferase MazF